MKLKAVYTVPELAEMSGLSRWQVRRLLDKNGVELRWNGKRPLVPLASFRRALPDIWESILDREAL